jgi:vacuole membrane protein 1
MLTCIFLLPQTLFIVSLCNNQLLYLIEKELIWIFGHIPGFSATLPSVIAKLHAAKDKYLSPPAAVSSSSQMEVGVFSSNP